MAEKREPIIDHYGNEITVEPLMGSVGPCVDLEWGERSGKESDFLRLTPDQARELAQQLVEAADFRG